MEKAKTILTDGTHSYTEKRDYVPVDNPEVRKHLEWFRGLKLGFMVHWSPVTQLGINTSWPLSDGDRLWSQRDIDWVENIEEFKQQYWTLNETFNPIRFRPDRWARLAKDCGFQYLLFTTKHHDGFCMFDTKTTDYRITHPSCPFSRHKYANITKELFNAFRAEGLAISAYFSKADWHSDAYWHRAFGPAPTRNPNYNISEHPMLWEEFVQYTHQQFRELTSEYGKIDTLWLDGGWVRPDNGGQDLRLAEIIGEIRSTTQPHLIVCDRTVGGPYENIVTPEQRVPEEALDIPWESNLTVGNSFSFRYDDVCKSTREIVHTFIDIVSKGGNLALNITPQPDGELPRTMVHRLRQLGNWLSPNCEAIYGSSISPCKPIRKRNLRYTRQENADYCFYLYEDTPYMAPYIIAHVPFAVKGIRLLRTGQTIPFVQDGEQVTMDTSEVSMVGAEYADCFALLR
ncbi:MAG: alpha-L-fucosidase [Provencibacterium sp.]|nr:alpha-L-fucosidase [Provencibacterium sp.]